MADDDDVFYTPDGLAMVILWEHTFLLCYTLLLDGCKGTRIYHNTGGMHVCLCVFSQITVLLRLLLA